MLTTGAGVDQAGITRYGGRVRGELRDICAGYPLNICVNILVAYWWLVGCVTNEMPSAIWYRPPAIWNPAVATSVMPIVTENGSDLLAKHQISDLVKSGKWSLWAASCFYGCV